MFQKFPRRDNLFLPGLPEDTRGRPYDFLTFLEKHICKHNDERQLLVLGLEFLRACGRTAMRLEFSKGFKIFQFRATT